MQFRNTRVSLLTVLFVMVAMGFATVVLVSQGAVEASPQNVEGGNTSRREPAMYGPGPASPTARTTSRVTTP